MRFTNADMQEVVEFIVSISRHLAQTEPGSVNATRAKNLAVKLSSYPTEKELELIMLLRKRSVNPLEEVQRYAAENNITLPQ